MLNKLRPVKTAVIPIRTIVTIVELEFSLKPVNIKKSNSICPIVQISHPTQKALKQFLNIGESGDFLLTYSLYCCFVSIGFA